MLGQQVEKIQRRADKVGKTESCRTRKRRSPYLIESNTSFANRGHNFDTLSKDNAYSEDF